MILFNEWRNGKGGGLVVDVLAFYFDDQSMNIARVASCFLIKVTKTDENNLPNR